MLANQRFALSFLILLLTINFCLAAEYDWVQRKEESLTFLYDPADKQLMDLLLPKIILDIDDFHRSVGFYPQIEGEIVIAPDREYYRNVIAGYTGIIEFSEAVYSAGEKRIYIRNPRDLRDLTRLRKIVLHEYIHLFLDSIFFNVPLWFHEGMAVYFSGDLSFDRELHYAKDYLLGNSLTLNEMVTGYPESRIRWESFYAKSALAVKYLYSEKREGFYSLWEYSDRTRDFYAVFFEAFNMTPHQFSPLFEGHLKRRFRIEMLLAFTGLLWSLLPFVLLLAWLRKKWLNRKIKHSWDNISGEGKTDTNNENAEIIEEDN